MFNKRFIFICSMVAVAALIAQPLAAADKTFGVKAGFASAGVSGIDGSSSLTGFTLGAFASFPVSGRLFIQPEINYVQKGMKYDFSLEGASLNAKVKVQYIEIPVLAKFNLTSGSSVTPSLLAGPYFAFKASDKLSGTVEYAGYEFDIEDFFDTDDLVDLKSTDFGIVLGGALDVPLGKNTLVFDLRYNLGLSEIAEDVKTRTFTATVGIGF